VFKGLKGNILKGGLSTILVFPGELL